MTQTPNPPFDRAALLDTLGYERRDVSVRIEDLVIDEDTIGEQRIICNEAHVLPVACYYNERRDFSGARTLVVEVCQEDLDAEGYTAASFKSKLENDVLSSNVDVVVRP